MAALIWVILGLVALILGAELVVRYGSRLARRLGVPPIVVGLTIVSLGTSAPELAVGIDAVRVGAGSLAVGNIAGTNIVNLLLILGLSAAIRPIVIGMQTIRFDLPAMAIASVLLLVLSLDGSLTVVEGVLLLSIAVVYTMLLIWRTKRESVTIQEEFEHEFPAEPRRTRGPWPVVLQLTLLIVGIVVIVVGADWLVDGAIELAQTMGVSDALIGLTIVAIGTSAPELATTMISTFRGERDIAVGNLIGSSTYNLTAILGASLLFADDSGITLDHELIAIDLPLMTLVALICVPVFLTGKKVTRMEGAFFVTAYAAYLGYLILFRT